MRVSRPFRPLSVAVRECRRKSRTLDAIDAERRTLRTRREGRAKAAAVMGRCRADGRSQMRREIEQSDTQVEAECLRGQLKPCGRHEKDVCADAVVVLMRMIAGTVLMVRLITGWQLFLLVVANVMVVVFVTVNVAVGTRNTKSLPCHRRVIVVAGVSTRTHAAAAGKLLDGEGHEHHE